MIGSVNSNQRVDGEEALAAMRLRHGGRCERRNAVKIHGIRRAG
jgi:hypothetical protein